MATAEFSKFAGILSNAQKYLIETRCSGALTKPYSAIALELDTGSDPEPDPEGDGDIIYPDGD